MSAVDAFLEEMAKSCFNIFYCYRPEAARGPSPRTDIPGRLPATGQTRLEHIRPFSCSK